MVRSAAGVLFGVWWMHVQTNGRVDALTRDVAGVRERIATLEGEVRGFLSAFRVSNGETPAG